MLPDQSQGFCQAMENSGALGFIFSGEFKDIWDGDVGKGLELYEEVRKESASECRLQVQGPERIWVRGLGDLVAVTSLGNCRLRRSVGMICWRISGTLLVEGERGHSSQYFE